MKKLFTILLALAMVLSVTTSAFAATGFSSRQALAKSNGLFCTDGLELTLREGKNDFVSVKGDVVPYGETVYIPLVDLNGKYVTSDVSAADLRITDKWDSNGKYIDSVEMYKQDSYWCFVIETTGEETREKEVEGVIVVSGYAFDADGGKVKLEKTEISVTLTLGFEYADDLTVYKTPMIFDFDDMGEQEEDTELSFDEDSGVSFTVDTRRQSKLVISMDTETDEDVEWLFPDADCEFFNFNGASFGKTGKLVIPADEDSYLYEISDGALRSVSAKYDSYEDGFVLKTDTLNRYIVSDEKLTDPVKTPGDIDEVRTVCGETQILVSWTRSANCTSYALQRKVDDGSWSTVSSTLKTLRYADTSVKAGKTYAYRVRGVNSSGNGRWEESDDAEISEEKPGRVNDLTAKVQGTSIELTWKSASGAKSYTIQRETNNGSWKTLSTSWTKSYYTDEDVKEGNVYRYRIKARNNAGYGEQVTTEAITLGTVPGPISSVTAAATAGKITVKWAAASGATTYGVQRRAYVNRVWSDWTNLSTTVSGTQYEDSSVAAGTTYQYRVQGRSAVGVGPFKVCDSLKAVGATPGAIASATATATVGQIDVKWSASANADRYVVQRRAYVDRVWSGYTTLSTSVASTSYRDTSVTGGTTYQYRVRGVNGAGSGAFKATTRIKAALSLPGAISSATATASAGKIRVQWTGSTGATSYMIQKRVYSGGVWSGYTTLSTSLTGTSYEDTAVTGGTVYQYRVRGRNAAGYGAFKATASTKAAVDVPGAVASMTATPSAGKITVSWSAAANADTYLLQRRLYAGGVWSSWGTLGSSLTARTYEDTTVAGGTVYQYRVRARNASGYGPFKNGTSVTAVKAAVLPGPISSVNASASAGRINLAWAPSSGADSYMIQRKVNGGSWTTFKSSQTGTSCADTDVVPGSTYQYRVRGRNADGYGDYAAGLEVTAV